MTLVNAREIHKNLEIKEDYTFWIEKLVEEFNLKYGIDYYYTLPNPLEGQKTLSATENVNSYYVTSFVKNLIIERYLYKFSVYTMDIWKSIKSKKDYNSWINHYIEKFKWIEGKHYIKLKKLYEDPRIGELRQGYMITKQAKIELLEDEEIRRHINEKD